MVTTNNLVVKEPVSINIKIKSRFFPNEGTFSVCQGNELVMGTNTRMRRARGTVTMSANPRTRWRQMGGRHDRTRVIIN